MCVQCMCTMCVQCVLHLCAVGMYTVCVLCVQCVQCMCAHLSVNRCISMHIICRMCNNMLKSQDNFVSLFLSFHPYMVPRIELRTLYFCSQMSSPAESFFRSLHIILKGRALIEVGLTGCERNLGLENPKC